MNRVQLAFTLFVTLVTAANGAGVFNNFQNRVESLIGGRPLLESGLLKSGDRVVNALHPSGWLNKVVENVPSLDSISYDSLCRMPVDAASTLLQTIFMHSHLSESAFTGSLYSPNENEIEMYLITANGNISIPLRQPLSLSQYPQLANGEVSIFITGFPSNPEDPRDAISKLVEAYRVRYQLNDNSLRQLDSWDSPSLGNLIVIDLGNSLNTLKKWATLDIKKVGEAVGQTIVDISTFVPYYNIHLIGHSVGAHVAGAAAEYYSQIRGNQLRRVTGLDPSKVLTKAQHIQSELNRGVANFVDVIHSTSYGIGADTNGDVDFYPNGPGSVAPGSEDIIEASLKSVLYYAESVLPQYERSFMAVECNSMQDYDNHHCHGIRIPMGYNTPVDGKGSYVLRVNSKAPYGRNAKNLVSYGNRSSSFRW